jgi:hypothetical protein
MGQHTPRPMMLPAQPGPYLVLVQAQSPLPCLQGRFGRPAPACDSDHGGAWRGCRCLAERARALRPLSQGPPQHHPHVWARPAAPHRRPARAGTLRHQRPWAACCAQDGRPSRRGYGGGELGDALRRRGSGNEPGLVRLATPARPRRHIRRGPRPPDRRLVGHCRQRPAPQRRCPLQKCARPPTGLVARPPGPALAARPPEGLPHRPRPRQWRKRRALEGPPPWQRLLAPRRLFHPGGQGRKRGGILPQVLRHRRDCLGGQVQRWWDRVAVANPKSTPWPALPPDDGWRAVYHLVSGKSRCNTRGARFCAGHRTRPHTQVKRCAATPAPDVPALRRSLLG